MIFILSVALLFGLSLAANTKQADLLEVTDRLYIVDDVNGSTVERFDLSRFQYVMSYTSNVTLHGDFCYSIDIKSFVNDCHSK